MISAATIESDPCWLPHDIDPRGGGKVHFLKVQRDKISGHGFLAEIATALDEAWISVDDVRKMQAQAGPVHFIFHSGFCRSTLLMRALQVEGKSIALAEPGILNALARYGQRNQALVDAVVRLLARPHSEGESVLIKPSNFPNRLVPSLMKSQPDARAIFVTNGLPDF